MGVRAWTSIGIILAIVMDVGVLVRAMAVLRM